MDLSTLYNRLHNLTQSRIVKSDIARILEIDPAQLRRKEVAGIDLKQTELKTIAEAYEVPLQAIICQQNVNDIIGNVIRENDIVKIPYWVGLPDELKIPDFTCVTAERNVIKNHWGLNPESLCIVPMVGDAMTNYWYPIRNGDILIINTQIEDIRGNGVYFGTSQNNTRFWIREMQILMDMSIEFKSFSPSGNVNKTYSAKQLEDVDFKLVGKVIKNVSFRL